MSFAGASQTTPAQSPYGEPRPIAAYKNDFCSIYRYLRWSRLIIWLENVSSVALSKLIIFLSFGGSGASRRVSEIFGSDFSIKYYRNLMLLCYRYAPEFNIFHTHSRPALDSDSLAHFRCLPPENKAPRIPATTVTPTANAPPAIASPAIPSSLFFPLILMVRD